MSFGNFRMPNTPPSFRYELVDLYPGWICARTSGRHVSCNSCGSLYAPPLRYYQLFGKTQIC